MRTKEVPHNESGHGSDPPSPTFGFGGRAHIQVIEWRRGRVPLLSSRSDAPYDSHGATDSAIPCSAAGSAAVTADILPRRVLMRCGSLSKGVKHARACIRPKRGTPPWPDSSME